MQETNPKKEVGDSEVAPGGKILPIKKMTIEDIYNNIEENLKERKIEEVIKDIVDDLEKKWLKEKAIPFSDEILGFKEPTEFEIFIKREKENITKTEQPSEDLKKSLKILIADLERGQKMYSDYIYDLPDNNEEKVEKFIELLRTALEKRIELFEEKIQKIEELIDFRT